MLSNDDPVLAEGSSDPILNGVLVNGSKVNVGTDTRTTLLLLLLLLLWMEVGQWGLTKTCLP